MENFWPNASTIDRAMTQSDRYDFFYKGARCYITLDSRGMFHGKAGSALVVACDLREVLDQMWQKVRQ